MPRRSRTRSPTAVHDASKNLPEYWDLNDTYYNWTANVRGVSHVLTTVSDAPFDQTGDGPTINALAGGTMGADHPVTWCKDYQGGRSYYTNHGASAAAFDDANLAVLKELIGAITWAAGQSDPVYSDCGATVLANYQQSFVRPAEPERADRLRPAARRPGRVIQTDRRGGVRLHDPVSQRRRRCSRSSPSTSRTRTGCTGPRSTTTSTRTSGSTSTTPRRPSRTSGSRTGRCTP